MSTTTVERLRSSLSTKPLHLLILEHSENDVDLILFELKGSGYLVEPTIAENREQFRQALESGTFDAVLADFRLPNWTGLEALEELRSLNKDIPFLLVTGTLGEEAAVDCIKQGVSDYVLKHHLARLPVALQRALNEKALRDENERAFMALAENAARARQQFAELDLLYRTAPICIAVLDKDFRCVRVNEAMARNHGMTPEEHVGRSLRELVPEVAESVTPLYCRVFETGEPLVNFELHARRTVAPFEARDYLTNFYPLRDAEGMISSGCVILVDITERKRSEEAIRFFETRNRDLVENAVYGIFRASADGTFLDFNPAFIRMIGCNNSAELRAMNFAKDIFRYPEQHTKIMKACHENGQIHGAEAEWRRKDGGLIVARLHLRKLPAESSPEDIEVIAEDITEFRALERQLRQAQKFEAIGQLAGGIAHDFNNVVGAIIGWAELGYEQNRTNPQTADRFARIREQAERAAALTRELLAFARRQVLQPRSVDLNTVTSGLVSFLDKIIGKDIELKIVTNPLDPVKADPTQVEQVLMNLCLNARDAMPNGGRLVIESEMVELDEAYCRFYPYVTTGRYEVLSVSDTGMGMDTETRERIFEPFFTTKEQGKGTGIGLATVYGIVKQHNGFIHVYSEVGQGSLFRVYLPVLQDSVSQGTTVQVPASSTFDMRGTETILIAEDHESIREMARQTLIGFGYRVLSASNGEEALRLCEGETPDLAVLDVIMPKLGGPATATKLTALFEELPILFTSGYSADSENLISLTPDARYLQKPYSPTSLGRLVREILDKNRSEKTI